MVVLDVRPEAEYAAGHILGGISIPINDLKSRLGDIPDGAHVVAYCRGPYCVYADEAVRDLVKEGWAAARLEDGFPEWADDRLPVAKLATVDGRLDPERVHAAGGRVGQSSGERR